MNNLLPFVIAGAAAGSVYGIAAIGLVTSYKTSGIFNFAYGSIAAVAAAVFYQLYAVDHLEWPIAALITLIICGVGLGIVFERIGAALAPVAVTMRIVATVGLMISLSAIVPIWYGPSERPFPSFLPQGSVDVSGVYIQYSQIIIVALGLCATVGLTTFFRTTLLGKQMQAIVDDPLLIMLTGTSAASVRRYSWIISCCAASIAGMLIAPAIGLDSTGLTLLVVEAFGAAAIGRFSSIGWTYVGAIVIGLLAALITKWSVTIAALNGLSSALPFIALFILILVTPGRSLPDAGTDLHRRQAAIGTASRRVAIGKGIVLLAAAIAIPYVAHGYLATYTLAVVYLIVFMSLSILLRTANLVSLSQISFVAIGAVVYYHLDTIPGFTWFGATLGAVIVSVVAGIILGVPAIRRTGIYLALVTLGLGILLQQYLYSTNLMFGTSTTPLATPRPSWAQSDDAYYWLVVIAAIIVYVVVLFVERGRLGRLLRMRADSPSALVASGASPSITPVIVFAVSAGMAGFAGALIGPVFGVIGAGSVQTFPQSALMVALVMLAARNPRIGILGGCVVATVGFTILPAYISNGTTVQWLNLAFGLFAVEAAAASSGYSVKEVFNLRRKADRMSELRSNAFSRTARGPATAVRK